MKYFSRLNKFSRRFATNTINIKATDGYANTENSMGIPTFEVGWDFDDDNQFLVSIPFEKIDDPNDDQFDIYYPSGIEVTNINNGAYDSITDNFAPAKEWEIRVNQYNYIEDELKRFNTVGKKVFGIYKTQIISAIENLIKKIKPKDKRIYNEDKTVNINGFKIRIVNYIAEGNELVIYVEGQIGENTWISDVTSYKPNNNSWKFKFTNKRKKSLELNYPKIISFGDENQVFDDIINQVKSKTSNYSRYSQCFQRNIY